MKKLTCLKCERTFWTREQGLCRKHRPKQKRRQPRIPRGAIRKKPTTPKPTQNKKKETR